MPFSSRKDLPEPVKEHLPAHAEEIYKEAYNSAWDQYKDPDKRRSGSREEVAHKVDWSAVKQKYEKNQQGEWVEK